jgi:AcrR family transcriptional regulator
VLDRLEVILEAALFEPLRSDRSPAAKLGAMLDALASFYDDGRQACLLERLAASVDHKSFRRPLARAFERWIDAVEALAREAGLPPALARARAEDLVVRVEGALIVAAGSGDTKVFTRTLAALRSSLLARN